MPEYGEKIIVKTWPHSIESLCTYRQFEVLDEKGNQIAKATSRWIIYSFEKMRPIRLSDELKEMYALVDDVVLPNEFEKMDNVSSNADFTYDGIIEFRDVDVNWHMNNVRYIRKFMEAMSPEFLDKYEVDFYDIQYIHQMKADDNYTIYVKKVNEDEYIYNMIKQGNEEGKVNSSAHIKWRRINESNN